MDISLERNKSSRHIHRWQLDILSIPNYVIKKGRTHGKLHEETETQKEHFIAHNLRKRCIKRVLKWIPRSLSAPWSPPPVRDSQLRIDRTRSKMHPDGRGGAERFHLSLIVRRVWEILEGYLSQHIWTKCTDETPIRLQRSINKDGPSSPWVWRRMTCTVSFLAVSEMAFVLFIQHIMVAVERSLVELIISIKVKCLWARDMSGITEQGDLLKRLSH